MAVPFDTLLTAADALTDGSSEVVYTPVGDVFVAERTAESGVVFGGEPSVAWIWPEGARCPDGPLAACRLVDLVASAGPLSALIEDLPQYPIHRSSVRTDDKRAVIDQVRERAHEQYADIRTLDGVRIGTDDRWFLVRVSGTQPLVRITAEARDEDDVDALFSTARELAEQAI